MVFLPRVFLGRPFSPAPASLFLSPACPVWAGFVVSPTPLQQPAVSSEGRHCSLSTSLRFCNNTNKDLPVCFVFFFFKMGGGGGGVESQLLGCSIFKLLLFLFFAGNYTAGFPGSCDCGAFCREMSKLDHWKLPCTGFHPVPHFCSQQPSTTISSILNLRCLFRIWNRGMGMSASACWLQS